MKTFKGVKNQLHILFRLFYCVAAIVTLASADSASAQSIESSVPAGAKILRSQKVSVNAEGATGSDLFVPGNGTFTLDYAVESNKEALFTLLTGEQYQEISAGKKPSGDPVLRATVSGGGRKTVELKRGDYFLAINNKSSTATTVAIRASFTAN